MERNERMLVGLATLLLLGTAAAREEPLSLAPVAAPPVQEPLAVVAQAPVRPNAGTAGANYDYLLNTCAETDHRDPRSAMRGVDPAAMLRNHLYSYASADGTYRRIDPADVRTTLVRGTRHGRIFSSVDNTGYLAYHYDPNPGHIGNDNAVFLGEFEGRRYKIVVTLRVLEIVNENDPTCPGSRLIRLNSVDGSRH